MDQKCKKLVSVLRPRPPPISVHAVLKPSVRSVDSDFDELMCTKFYCTASTGNDRGTKRRGFMLKSVITHRGTTPQGHLNTPTNEFITVANPPRGRVVIARGFTKERVHTLREFICGRSGLVL